MTSVPVTLHSTSLPSSPSPGSRTKRTRLPERRICPVRIREWTPTATTQAYGRTRTVGKHPDKSSVTTRCTLEIRRVLGCLPKMTWDERDRSRVSKESYKRRTGLESLPGVSETPTLSYSSRAVGNQEERIVSIYVSTQRITVPIKTLCVIG